MLTNCIKIDIVQKKTNGRSFLEVTQVTEQIPSAVPAPDSEPQQQSYLPIDDIGAITVPPRFWGTLGIGPSEPLWVVLSEVAIIIKKTAFGYRGCDMEQCTMTPDGKIEIPMAFLHRLVITARGEVLFALSRHEGETVLETLATTL